MWTKNFEDKAAWKLWRRDLKSLGVNDETILVGLDRSAKCKFPPSPAEFADLCLPSLEDLKIPDVKTAYREATQGNYLHSIAWLAASKVGFFEVRSKPEHIVFQSFKSFYEKYAQQAREGTVFTMPERKKLTDQHTPTNPQVAKDHLARMAEIVGLNQTEEEEIA